MGGGVIDIVLPKERSPIPDDAIVEWIHNAADAVTAYFGRFPVRQVTITISTGGWRGVSGGMTTHDGISVSLAPHIRQRNLDSDWVMTHEMFHLAFPQMNDDHAWLSEGLATYLEPIARARLGFITPEKLWRDMIEGCPQGQPQASDQGLARTHTWGRTYWGGATFCLLADLQIREQTQNRRSLDDATRAILDHGGDHLTEWPIERVLETGDRATGTRVLHDLYAEMSTKPVEVNLPDLWKRLGIQDENRAVHFDDSAPLAKIRESITRRISE